MVSYMVKRLSRIICLLYLLSAASVHGALPSQENVLPGEMYTELKSLFHRFYPQVTSHVLNNKIHFEYNTRIYIVHEQLKTGEWQDPVEERGPQKGGILCDITLVKGKYLGAAAVPQTFDKRYFNLMVMAPYSIKKDSHLYIHLLFPRDVDAEFLRQFSKIVNKFGSND